MLPAFDPRVTLEYCCGISAAVVFLYFAGSVAVHTYKIRRKQRLEQKIKQAITAKIGDEELSQSLYKLVMDDVQAMREWQYEEAIRKKK